MIVKKVFNVSDQNEEMDISPTQLHPPAKRAVFQSPLTVPTSCTSPLLTTQVNNQDGSIIMKDGPDLSSEGLTRPAFDTTGFQTYNNHPYHHAHLSYDHTPLSCLSGVRKPNNYSPNHTHQCMESAFLPFKTANGLTPSTSNLTPPTSSLSPPTSDLSPSEQLPMDDSHFDPMSSLNPVTTIS